MYGCRFLLLAYLWLMELACYLVFVRLGLANVVLEGTKAAVISR